MVGVEGGVVMNLNTWYGTVNTNMFYLRQTDSTREEILFSTTSLTPIVTSRKII